MPLLSQVKRQWENLKYNKNIVRDMGSNIWRTICAQYGEALGKGLTKSALILTIIAGFFAFMGRDSVQLVFSSSGQGGAAFVMLSGMYLELARDIGLAVGAAGFIGHWLRRNGIYWKAQEEKLKIEGNNLINLNIASHEYKQKINQLKAKLPRAPGTSLKKSRKKRRK